MTRVFGLGIIKPRVIWGVFLATGLLAAGGCYWFWPRPALNVLLVTFDTTRADRLGAYGYPHGLTQAFDEFSKRGVLFERAFAPAPITLPAHATMLTGLYPPEHGLRVNGSGQLPQEIPHLPEILKNHGYETGAFVSAAGVLGNKFGLVRGFDTYDDHPAKKKSAGRKPYGEPRRDGEETVDLALAWLRQRTTRPFFCWIHLYDAHAPYEPRPEVYQDRFERNPYDAGIAWEVQQFGRLTSYLQESGLAANTLVVAAGDHGEGLDEHQEDEHGMLVYNSTLHVPFVFVGPRICQPETRVAGNVSLVDLTPTLLDVLQLPPPKHLSGRSLLPALEGKSIDPRDCYAEAETPFAINGWAPLRTMISERWKYIHSTRPELYDLEKDPGELTDLIETAADEAERMRNRFVDLQKEFVLTTAQNVTLSEKDRRNLESLGYVTGNKPASGEETTAVRVLPDVKDFLPYLAKYEKAKHLARESQVSHSQDDLKAAIALLEEVVHATQEFPVAELLLGDCLALSGRLEEAEKTYRSQLQRHPESVRTRLKLGKVLSDLGRFEESAAEYREFLKDHPDSAATFLELAQALTQLRNYDEAIEACRDAIRIAPDFVPARLQMGRLFVSLQRLKEAEACFTQALEVDPGSVDLRSHLLMVLVQTSQFDKALREGRRLVVLAPKSFDARYNMGVVLLATKRYREAISELQIAQRLRPDDPRPAQQIQQAEAAIQRQSP